jgi:UDP-2,3-diacylglucosamine pyrophosphatase LpxH
MTELLIGDCHFGTHSNNISWLQHQVNFFNTQVYDILENKDIDRIVFLGDVFDVRYSVNTHIGIEVKKIFRHLLSYGIPVYVVAGNHDYYSPLKELQDYNAYELVFGEEFERAYKNLHIVKYDPLLVDGSLFLPFYWTENPDHFDELLYTYKFGYEVKAIYCHADLTCWPGARITALKGCPIYSGHIHYIVEDDIGNLYVIFVVIN